MCTICVRFEGKFRHKHGDIIANPIMHHAFITRSFETNISSKNAAAFFFATSLQRDANKEYVRAGNMLSLPRPPKVPPVAITEFIQNTHSTAVISASLACLFDAYVRESKLNLEVQLNEFEAHVIGCCEHKGPHGVSAAKFIRKLRTNMILIRRSAGLKMREEEIWFDMKCRRQPVFETFLEARISEKCQEADVIMKASKLMLFDFYNARVTW
ncbi:unnamed protein product, partial [Allacma fusca]